MTHSAVLLFAALASLGAEKANAGVRSGWERILGRASGGRTEVSIQIGGPVPFERDADGDMPPASVTKLITAAAALERLGPDFCFETQVRWRDALWAGQGSIAGLTVEGSGDPTWGMTEFDADVRTPFVRIAQALKARGIREILGEIRLAAGDPRWTGLTPPTGWTSQDVVECNGSLPQAFNLQLNCALLKISGPGTFQWREPGIPAPVQIGLQRGRMTEISVSHADGGIALEGSWGPSRGTRTLAVSVPDATAWSARLLVEALANAGIQLRPEVSLPEEGQSIESIAGTYSLSFPSPPLRELLKPMLKKSLNLVAETLLVAMGGPDTVKDYLLKHLPEAKTLHFWDGSGLSREGRASARDLYAFLEDAKKAPFFPVFWDALSIAGVDGTLAGRMRRTPAEGILRGKTGTLNGYYQLAGYVPIFDGAGHPADFAPFVFLMHGNPSLRWAIHETQDLLGAELARIARNH